MKKFERFIEQFYKIVLVFCLVSPPLVAVGAEVIVLFMGQGVDITRIAAMTVYGYSMSLPLAVFVGIAAMGLWLEKKLDEFNERRKQRRSSLGKR